MRQVAIMTTVIMPRVCFLGGGHESLDIRLAGKEVGKEGLERRKGELTVWVLRPLCTRARFLLYNWILKKNKANQGGELFHLPHLGEDQRFQVVCKSGK